MDGWFQVIIVPSTSFTLVLCLLTLDRTVCQILKFTSVYVGLCWLAGTWSSTIVCHEQKYKNNLVLVH